MEFHATSPFEAPKNLYPCLATITVAPSEKSGGRRMSSSSNNGDEDNALKRVISRRKSNAGGEEKMLEPSHVTGKWYWRVQAGVTDTHLVLLPLSNPANPLLTSAPAPLSTAMPAHSTHKHTHDPAHSEEKPGLLDKVKHALHLGGDHKSANADTTVTGVEHTTADRVVDQTAQGDQLPSGKANAVGADNLNANAETGWPGCVDGQKLGAVTVKLGEIEESKVSLNGGKKDKEGASLVVPVTSLFSSLVHPMLESVGQKHHESWSKTGSIRFDFDKEWIGAKAEAELLHHHLTSAINNVQSGHPVAGIADRSPKKDTLKLGSHGKTNKSDGIFQDPFLTRPTRETGGLSSRGLDPNAESIVSAESAARSGGVTRTGEIDATGPAVGESGLYPLRAVPGEEHAHLSPHADPLHAERESNQVDPSTLESRLEHVHLKQTPGPQQALDLRGETGRRGVDDQGFEDHSLVTGDGVVVVNNAEREWKEAGNLALGAPIEVGEGSVSSSNTGTKVGGV